MTTTDDLCEIRDDGRWELVSIEDALHRPGEIKRCPNCHGRVRAHRAGTTGQRAHFEHLRAHPGCPTKPAFAGRPSRHPEAID